MSDRKTLAFLLMDAPFESARTASAFRLLHAAAEGGHDIKVFAYEGASALSFARQAAHPNAVHGRDAEQEAHPLPRLWIGGILELAQARGAKVDWVNCGLCVDERGVGENVPGTQRGSPADFWTMVQSSHNTLVIATR
jgi:tRNA 2-thiouridine synthesizing protein D